MLPPGIAHAEMMAPRSRQLAKQPPSIQTNAMCKYTFIAGLLCSLALTSPASASSSDWFETEGGRVRLVTAGQAGGDGKLTGILDIELKPGWKTYWRDPGDAGVPPTIDVTASPGVTGAEFSFPTPEWHDDGDFKWAGYDQSVALPITFTLASSTPGVINADVFLGVCETICIPVKATLAVDPARDPANPNDAAAVSAALAALPAPASKEFGVTTANRSGETIEVEAVAPGDPSSADLFIAGADGYFFGTPKKKFEEGRLRFSIPTLSLPDERPQGAGLHYTLVTDAGSVSGLLPYP